MRTARPLLVLLLACSEPPAPPAAAPPPPAPPPDESPQGLDFDERIRARPPATAPRWTLSWADEFDGPHPGDDPACFSRTPQCLFNVEAAPRDCPAEALANLAGLNTCNWSVYHFYNYMDQGKLESGQGINRFDAREVSVQGGALVLTARANEIGASDCGRQYDDSGARNWTVQCPIRSGGVHSRAYGPEGAALGEGIVRGFRQAFGRFEVRARLPSGPGTWPAHWMMPQDWIKGWPGDGEIDIMEAYAGTPDEVSATLHDTYELFPSGAERIHIMRGHNWKATAQYYSQPDYARTFVADFHVYAAEWDPEELRFFVDNREIGAVAYGQVVHHGQGAFPIDVPSGILPFYLILNSTIAPFAGSPVDLRPDPAHFAVQTHAIDWVRVYRRCASAADFCPWGGTREGDRCFVRLAPSGVRSFVVESRLYYDGASDCPQGGTRDGTGCLLAALPAGAGGFLDHGIFYTRTSCVESTLSPFCPNPCAGAGRYDGYNCFLGWAPEGFEARLREGTFDSRPWSRPTRPEECRLGEPFDPDRGGCVFGSVPAGREGFVVNVGGAGRFYLDPVCSTAAGLPNCPDPCPAGGRWDGSACAVEGGPALAAACGATPFGDAARR